MLGVVLVVDYVFVFHDRIILMLYQAFSTIRLKYEQTSSRL
jgi:hypothetical protein